MLLVGIERDYGVRKNNLNNITTTVVIENSCHLGMSIYTIHYDIKFQHISESLLLKHYSIK